MEVVHVVLEQGEGKAVYLWHMGREDGCKRQPEARYLKLAPSADMEQLT